MKRISIVWSAIGLLTFLSHAANAQPPQESHHSPFPHPLNATMAIPDPVGSYNIRLNTFRQQETNGSTFDASGHLSYGMFEWGGVHLRSLGVKTTSLTEIIGMVGLWKNQQRTQGISLLGILGVPTGRKTGNEHHGVSYLFGFTGRIATADVITNDIILHYDFTARHYIAETGTVVRLSPTLFATLDFRGAFGPSRPDVTLLPSLKLKIVDAAYVALGYNAALAGSSPFKSQIFLQVEFGSH